MSAVAFGVAGDQYVGTNTPFSHTPQCCQPSSQTCGWPLAQDGSTGFGGAQAGGVPSLGPAGGAAGGGFQPAGAAG